ncbi:MAG TPA: TetR/AcrR family transcriptional regulator [Pseudonocardia sp.]
MTDAITEATFAELAENGYARMSMDAVARRARVGKAALYRRWPSKLAMLTELIREAVQGTLPPVPTTGALHTDLRELLGTLRSQLAQPPVSSIALGLLAEARYTEPLSDMLNNSLIAPRRAAVHAVLQAAIDRGELPAQLDVELGTDLLVGPLAYRVLIRAANSDDDYLERLATVIESALKSAVL